ncbi:MAG: hypothetical protein PHV13_05365 [Candidatus ainarchaeum sp.]|nr:hypothetical protein [Candidatus ainarchaeum sp.]
MSTAHATALPPGVGHAAGKLAPWKDAIKAMPIVEALRPLIVKAGPLWIGIAGISPATLVIATRGNVRPAETRTDRPGVIIPVSMQKLAEPTAIKAITSQWPTTAKTEIVVIGPESVALTDLRAAAKTDTTLGTLFVQNDAGSVRLMELAGANAASWCKGTLAGLRAYLQKTEFVELPQSCLECTSYPLVTNVEETVALKHLLTRGADAFCKETGLTMEELRDNMRRIKKDLFERLGVACRAFSMGYMLHSVAKIVSEPEMAGLRAIAEFGTGNVGSYRHFSTAITKVDGGQREKIVGKILRLVGQDAENEVRDEFKVPRQAFVVVEKKEVPAASPAAVKERTPPPKAPVPRLSQKEQLDAISRELPGVPAAFIAKWVGMGMRNPEKIRAKYEQVQQHAPGMRKNADEKALKTRTAVHRTLEDRIAAIAYPPEITAAMRAKEFEPVHIGTAVCKVFNYPLSPNPRKRDGVEGYLAKYLNGEVRNPAKTAEAVFNFMYDSGLLVGNGRTMRINIGTENPTGSAILRAIRDGFET